MHTQNESTIFELLSAPMISAPLHFLTAKE